MLYNHGVMTKVENTLTVPFIVTEFGTIRIADSRVSLDSIVHNYKLGATAEQIAYSFPSLKLKDIHLAIAYYLTHRDEVEEYLRQQKTESEALIQQLESDPEYLKRSSELRDRILARWAARQESETHPSSN
jgi:uncharacterized protein (DUF433 family)